MPNKHIFSILVQNEPGVLAHVSGMFAARNFNIDSLVVGRTEDPSLSRMVLVSSGDDFTLEQVRKQLGKLVTAVKVRDIVASEMTPAQIAEAQRLAREWMAALEKRKKN